MSDPTRFEEYVSPFSTRYVDPEMSHLFSQEYKIRTFRKLWLSLAKAQQKAGLPISDAQLEQMRENLQKIDFATAHSYEKKFRHDVMAHIHAFGQQCPLAKPILHLGATSTYVTDNTDLIISKEALSKLFQKLLCLLEQLAVLAKQEAHTTCVGYTHFQIAQPTTVGKRFALWLQDLLLDAKEWGRLLKELPFLGLKGATGTQASFLTLLEGNEEKLQDMEQSIAKECGFTKVLPLSGQTYTRKLDNFLVQALAGFCASAHKIATDIRLLAHEGEICEDFASHQVGSSAMPYKRNPIYSERICGLARFVLSLSQNPLYTTATQWLERTLDDSSNRRLCLPEAFLGTDAVLNLLHHLFSHLQVHRETIQKHVEQASSQLVMEHILMQASKKGGDRQTVHEALRLLSQNTLSLSELLEKIANDPTFGLERKDLEPLRKPDSWSGNAPKQVFSFLKEELSPFLKAHPKHQENFPSIDL